MSFRFFVIIIFLGYAIKGHSAESVSSVVSQENVGRMSDMIKVQEMLFDFNGQAVTTFDFKLFVESYQKTKVFLSEDYLNLMKSQEDQFLVLKLVQKEAEQLGLDYDSDQYNQVINSFSKSEFRDRDVIELKAQLRTINLLGLKQRQLQDKVTLLGWLQVLKRKYLLNVKSEDFKTRLSIRI